jgi:class 3 adenylate cyclase
MVSLTDIREPVTADFLIGFTDLRAFLRVARELETSSKLFAFLDELAERMEAVVSESSGRILKYIGDAALIIFPGDNADPGIRTLLELKSAVDDHITSKGFDSRLAVAAHFGEATAGPFGPEKRLDIFGESVNRAAVPPRNEQRSEFTITPEAFRKLEPETRKYFRKHTPPIVYVTR